ncbi:MarR family winged helix-turn-helix transcriptional regulator [Sphaerisporangium dianthi]|uniref:MarR family winged helix-turn-helix transcriptional regulator n=1 Tax=Sphaerisporangium dianthi TaxID=1436120 RepID=A0ABV9CVK8_9ACTN
MSADQPGGDAASPLELITLMRRLNVELDRFVERFAVDHGLHRTDLNAVVVIMDAAREGRPLTPGALGAALNLSAPATTALLNRLEQAGHVERSRSETDRRKVELALHSQAVTLAKEFFTPLARHLSEALAPFTGEERQVILRFLTGSIQASVAARGGLGPR